MGDHLRKVRSGEKLSIPAETFNSFVDAARDLKERRQRQGTALREEQTDCGVVLVRNDSGDDRERFEILGVDVPIYSPTDNEDEFKNRVSLVGVTPTVATHAGKFVVLLEPAAYGEIARAMLLGVTPTRLDVADVADTFADVADGLCTHLATGTSGMAHIVWKESGTGLLWGLVRFPAGGGGGGGSFWQPDP